jgi:hypothetical protein
MATKIVPFTPHVTDVNPAASAAQELQNIVTKMESEGWKFVSLSSMQTAVKPTGCNTTGKSETAFVSIQLLVFSN